MPIFTFDSAPIDVLESFDAYDRQLFERLGLVEDPENHRINVVNVETGAVFTSFPDEWLADPTVDLFGWIRGQVENRYISSKEVLWAAMDGKI